MTGMPYDLACEITFDPPTDTTPTWVDFTSRLVSFRSFRGQQYNTDGPQPGTLEVALDNTDGVLDPDNTASAYYDDLVPNRRVRISAKRTSGSSWVRLATGYVDSIRRTWPGGLAYSETLLSCTDLTKFYALQNGGNHTVAQFSAAYHMNYLLAGSYTVGTGLIYDPITYTDKRWPYMQDLAIADGGFLFIEGDGSPIYHASDYRTTETVSTTSQATFTFGTEDGIAVVPDDLAPTMDDQLLANAVTVFDSAGTAHVATDSASVTKFGEWPFELVTNLSGAGANTRAAVLRTERKHPTTRHRAFTLDALTDADSLQQALERNISDRVTLLLGPLGGGAATTQDYWINSVEHDVVLSGGQQWRTTYQIGAVPGTLVAL